MSAKRARSDATMNVQLSASSSAPVTHAPLTAHSTGVVARPECRARVAGRSGEPRAGRHLLEVDPGAEHRIDRGDDDQRPGSASSASASSISAQNRARIAAVSAFLTSGRLIVIVRTPSASSTIGACRLARTCRLLGDAEALQAERLDGVAAEELVDLLVVQAGLRADLRGDLLRCGKVESACG